MDDESYFSDVLILWASRYDYDAGWKLLPHRHDDFYQIIYCVSGSGIAHVSTSDEAVVPSELIFLKPGYEHSIDHIGSEGLKTIDIKFIVRNTLLRKKLDSLPFFIKGCKPEIRDNLEQIRMEGESQDYDYIQYSQLYLSMILLDLLRMQQPLRRKDSKNINFYYHENLSDLCIKIMAYIENNYTSHITSDDISSALNYSYRYLSRITGKEIGCSPVEYIDWYRCHVAKEQLVLSSLALKEIAERVGYPNVHQFSRTFRRIVGTPPATYRQETLNSVRKDINFRKGFINENNTLRG